MCLSLFFKELPLDSTSNILTYDSMYFCFDYIILSLSKGLFLESERFDRREVAHFLCDDPCW